MVKTLRDHFPIIRDREEVLADIYSKEELLDWFESWEEEEQELFLDYCTGMRGVKILYDQYFKLVINPRIKPERLEKLLTQILGQKVTIIEILPNESTRIAAEKSLLVLDVVVKLEDGSIANVEVQRIGYAFPGQRSACYSADLLLRQYKELKKLKKKKFRYSDIKKVYTIVFFLQSTSEFHKYENEYVHHFRQKSDTGIEIELLQEYIFVSLDNFRKCLHNESVDIENEFEAWLTFLSEDDPEWILKLVELHPDFVELYKEVYEACRNTEAMMGLFSEELFELDKNTVEYMLEEQKKELEEKKGEIEEQKKELEEKKGEIEEKNKEIEEKDAIIASLKEQLGMK